MVALTQSRNTRQRDGETYIDPLAANAKVFAGGIVCLNAAGDAVSASTAVGLKVRGVAQSDADNTGGAAGARTVEARPGVYRFAILAADAVTRADLLATVYLVDDQTIARTNGANTRSAAGQLVDLDANGAWVRI